MHICSTCSKVFRHGYEFDHHECVTALRKLPLDELLKLAVTKNTNPPIAQLATAFVGVLHDWLTDEEFEEVRRRNREGYEDSAYACASHDFCDANLAMEEAWLKVLGRSPDLDDQDDTKTWNAAWELAHQRSLK